MLIEDHATVLFQGDSITDADRIREEGNDWGHGYAHIAASWFSALYPEKKVRFINRGISGDRANDLRRRWSNDCIDLQPTWVSILIGINDCWRRYDQNDPTSAETFEDHYRHILSEARNQLDVGIILCEPFVLPFPEDRQQWREDLDPKIHVVRRLAREFNALYIPLDGFFASASTKREPRFWAEDGVHPSPAGHALIAREWLKAVGAL